MGLAMRERADGEDKAHRFERLAERRVAELIKKIRLVGNLSNRSNYSYSDAHVRQMFAAIDRELKLAKDSFVPRESDRESKFRFQKSTGR
jgi:hypothetical protein